MAATSTPAGYCKEETLDLLRQLCDMHNAARGKLGDYDCPVCRNKGLIFRLNGLYEVARECECMPIRENIRRMKRSGLYDRLETQTFASFRAETPWQKEMLEIAKLYAEKHDRPGFFLGGQQGCGKTHLCTAVCASLLREGIAVQYFVWETYVKEILSRSGTSDREKREALMQPLYQSPALYLDDFLRKENPTQSERSVAFDVINRRYIDGKITIVSSEHAMDRLLQTDQAIASRIREMCGSVYCMSIEPDMDKNYRLREASDAGLRE